MTLSSLPEELKLRIVDACTVARAGRLSVVNKAFSALVTREKLLEKCTEPDLTELMFFTSDGDAVTQAELWRDLESLGTKAKAYKSCGFVMARLTDEEVEAFKTKYPAVKTGVNQIIAGQAYPPPAG